jgi:hypothetical protein
MNNTVILGISGKARSGKDTVAQTIYEHYKDTYNIKIFPFAKALKDEVNGLDQFAECIKHGIPYDFNPPMDDPMSPTKHGKQRELLQFWGGYKRAADPFYWVHKNATAILAASMFPEASHLSDGAPNALVALIPDMRYTNEAQWVKSQGGDVVRVTRIGYQGLVGSAGAHVSETQLDNYGKWDYEISNGEGELEQLKADALFVIDHLFKSMELKVLTQEELEAA